MKCRKCKVEIPDGSIYCLKCGAKQDVPHKTKNRGNGTGSVFQLKNKRWIAIKTVGYKAVDGKLRRVTRSKSGFKTKKEAIEYLPYLKAETSARPVTFSQVYEAWLPTHRAGKDTMNCYKAAYKYYEPVQAMKLQEITVDDLQACLDECPKGKRTKENMKTLCGLLYKYAIPRNLVTLNMGQYLIVGGGSSGNKDALPDDAIKLIEMNVGKVKGADYVLCQCYLGFRPSEFLALDISNYNRKEKAFVGGAKTDAGKGRVVTVSPKIQKIINRLTKNKISGPVFCAEDGSRMSIDDYRTMFYVVLEQCGIDNPVTERDGVKYHKYTPHSCRHTFATMMKRVAGADKDKLELIGHTSTEMLMHYQSIEFSDLRKITDAL